jgi:sulfatase-modifying factor enzyme 1
MGAPPAIPADLVLLLTEGVEMTFQRIPAGEFRMGARGEYRSEEPIHRVRITRPFYLGTFPVTQAQFAAWTQSVGIEHKNGFLGNPSHPAESMEWHQAVAFCDWLTQTCLRQTLEPQLSPGCAAGLPTEVVRYQTGRVITSKKNDRYAVKKRIATNPPPHRLRLCPATPLRLDALLRLQTLAPTLLQFRCLLAPDRGTSRLESPGTSCGSRAPS